LAFLIVASFNLQKVLSGDGFYGVEDAPECMSAEASPGIPSEELTSLLAGRRLAGTPQESNPSSVLPLPPYRNRPHGKQTLVTVLLHRQTHLASWICVMFGVVALNNYFVIIML